MKKGTGGRIKESKVLREDFGFMKKKTTKKELTDREYYDSHGVLGDIVDDDIDLSLDNALKEDILSGKRKRKLRNVSIKIDPLYLQSIKKIATMKGFPYQTLMRQWLIKEIKKELKIA
jgi:predicted DNA binding CopG/RHH family protein